MDDEIEQKLREAAERAELEYDDVVDRYEEQLADMKDNLASSIDDDELARNAAMIVKNDITNISGSSGGYGGGEVEEVPVLALGYRFREGDYFVTSGDGMVCLGIINPADDPAGVATFVLDSDDGVSLGQAREAFAPLTTTRAYVSRRQIGSRDGETTLRKGGNPTYLCNSSDQSKFEIVDPDSVEDDDPISELPADREAKRDLIHTHFIDDDETVTTQTYANQITDTNDAGFELAFGVDVKRFRGQVIDSYRDDEEDGFAVMTMVDDEVDTTDDVDDELVTDQMRTPGLQVVMDPPLMNYGENSILDVYGFVEQRQDNGQYRMLGFGAIPIVDFGYEGNGGSSSSNDDDDIQEDTL